MADQEAVSKTLVVDQEKQPADAKKKKFYDSDDDHEEGKEKKRKTAVLVKPNMFEPENHFYQKAINAQVSSVVAHFMNLGNERIVARYCHLNPNTDAKKLRELLSYKAKNFMWAGADLFNVTTPNGSRKMVLIETNSCPSGQKSMPILTENDEHGSYRTLIEKTFKPLIDERSKDLPQGELAVIYDKNRMEASGYATTMADVFKENVHLVEFYSQEEDPLPCVRFNDQQIMEVMDKEGNWHPIRAAFRYVTQKPWSRIPLVNTKTLILNPMIACLAGGRNKLVASKAYDFINAEYKESGIKLNVPKTIRDVSLKELSLWVNSFGGCAVVKNPYSNAGQGVWTITNKKELDDLMAHLKQKARYDQYIVQSLIGNAKWSSNAAGQTYYHIGTVPDKHSNIYVADLRMMIHYNYEQGGFAPLALYARRAAVPLNNNNNKDDCAPPAESSWDILGTNLSYKKPDGTWDTDTKRLIIVDRRDFNRLGLGVDDLIDAYIQTVLATVAIDKLGARLMKGHKFDMELFGSLDRDDSLLKEILI